MPQPLIHPPQYRAFAQKAALLLGASLAWFAVIEAGYRLFDPFPYFGPDEINQTQHGNLSMYDPVLGWRGVPGGQAELVTDNNRVRLVHNADGFRDIEHPHAPNGRPAVVFLGDSFTWGYEVAADEMFVNRLRERLPDDELFNLSHRGYGTDQELLTFTTWRSDWPVRLVILMYCENDAGENNATVRYDKPKPRYQLAGNDLVLTGVPVPETESWTRGGPPDPPPPSLRTMLKSTLVRSHFLHDLYFRASPWLLPAEAASASDERTDTDLTLTSRILEALKREVERRGSRLVVFFIPSQREIEHLDDRPPYQHDVAAVCQRQGIEHVDLAPAFHATWRRTYYRYGSHWNARGHRVAAEAIYSYLAKNAQP